jgi:hypothetical protein
LNEKESVEYNIYMSTNKEKEKTFLNGLYKFIKKHAGIPFEPISTFEEMTREDEERRRYLERRFQLQNRGQTKHEIEEV